MHVGNQRCSELRGFSANGYMQGIAGSMPGSDTNTIINVLLRVLDYTDSTERVASNVNGSTGWRLNRDADTVVNNTLCASFTATLFGAGGGNSVTATVYLPFSQVVGQIFMLSITHDQTDHSLGVFVNGAIAASDTDGALTLAASTETPTVGADVGGSLPLTSVAILALGYADNLTDSAVLDLPEQYLQALKVGDLCSTSNLVYKNLYSARKLAGFAGTNGAGYPRTMANLGSGSAAQVLTKQGEDPLVVGNPQVVWGSPMSVIEWDTPPVIP